MEWKQKFIYPEQQTCYFIWYTEEYDKIFSTYSGKKEIKTWRIMSQNTTQYGTTEICDQDILN